MKESLDKHSGRHQVGIYSQQERKGKAGCLVTEDSKKELLRNCMKVKRKEEIRKL